MSGHIEPVLLQYSVTSKTIFRYLVHLHQFMSDISKEVFTSRQYPKKSNNSCGESSITVIVRYIIITFFLVLVVRVTIWLVDVSV